MPGKRSWLLMTATTFVTTKTLFWVVLLGALQLLLQRVGACHLG
jgi:hypothetical protein